MTLPFTPCIRPSTIQSEGVSAKMADKIGLTDTKVLIPQKGHLKKLTTYVPENADKDIRDALFKAGAGHIGDYSHCSFNMSGEGTYLGGEYTNPSVGKPGKFRKVNETFISVHF